MSNSKVRSRGSIPPRLFMSLFLGIGLVCLMSCNVTRKVTTTSEMRHSGDTSITIQSHTVESYSASKKSN